MCTEIKLCGIQTVEAAEEVARLHVEAVGFVFAPSRRKVTVDEAKEMSTILPKTMKKVGVFVNETIENIEHIAKEVGLTHIQLHGHESVAFCQQLSLPCWKAFSIATRSDLEQITNYLPYVERIVLDGPKELYYGGNGKVFNWSWITEEIPREKLVVAGGLTIDNVDEAIKCTRAIGVDVSSGIETNGVKDIQKMRAFVDAIRRGKHAYSTE